MTACIDADAATATGDRARRHRARWRRARTPTLLAAMVAAMGLLPLIGNKYFYYWDDTAAAFMPAWRVIGQRLLDGSFPAMLPEFWSAGNFLAESLYGLYNPVILADSVVVALLPDLAVGAIFLKVQFMVILAIGVYLLCRDYGANRQMAFVAGLVMPFAGYTLYFEGEAWVSGLIAFSWIPYVWWGVRGAAQGRRSPFFAIAFGFLAMTTGNPYGAVAVIVVHLAVLAEVIAQRDFARIRSLVLTGAAIALMGAATYLPLLLTAAVTVRTQSGAFNDGYLVPGLGDLLNLSVPTANPRIAFPVPQQTVPFGYLAWFIIPLLPWIRWRSLAGLGRGAVSLGVFGGVYLVLNLGPSNLWLFRWPIRLTEYTQLALLVVVAFLLSQGLHRTRLRRRITGTAALLAGQTYLSWSATPDLLGTHMLGLVLVVALVALTLGAYRRRPGLLAPSLAFGVVLILFMQTTQWFTGNRSITAWKFPHNVGQMHEQYASKYRGTTFVIGDPGLIDKDLAAPYPKWNDLLFGSAFHAAGVQSVNVYSGISYEKFGTALCTVYFGATPCSDTLGRLTDTAPGTRIPWYNAMNLETIVTQDSGNYGDLAAVLSPYDWDVRHEGTVTVAHRKAALPWPNGRLAEATPGLTVGDDVAKTDRNETVTVGGAGVLTFARLAWPGYQATLNGRPIPTTATAAGLLQVPITDSVPPGAQLNISWSPPGSKLGLGLFLVGLVLAVGQVAYVHRRRRNHSRPTSGSAAAAT